MAAALALTGCSAIEGERRSSGSPGASPRTVAAEAPLRLVASAPAIDSPVWPADAPAIYAQSAILIDGNTGRVIYQKNADQRRQVASTQKLLTALLVVERGNLDGMVTVAASDTRTEPTNLGFRAGQVYSRRSLLTAMLVKSCNDIAELFARDHSGSNAAFAAAMTRRAQQLGATSSFFANAHGLPGAQFSTARDMARIAFHAYRKPDIRAMTRLRSYTFRFSNGRTRYLESTNKLLSRSMMHDGLKTGFTFAAGRCLVSSASIGGRSLILVQLKSKTTYIFDDADRMLRWGFQQSGGAMFAQRDD